VRSRVGAKHVVVTRLGRFLTSQVQQLPIFGRVSVVKTPSHSSTASSLLYLGHRFLQTAILQARLGQASLLNPK